MNTDTEDINEYINEDDPRIQYQFSTGSYEEDLKEATQEYTPTEKVDYMTCRSEGDKPVPISFTKLKNSDEATEWYIEHHGDKYTDQVCGIIARSHFPPPKTESKKEPASVFSIEHKVTEIRFD